MKRHLLLYTVLFFISCSKGSSGEKDREAPVVVLHTPVNNQVFTGGQNIMIAGTVTDNKYIKEIHIEITNLATAAEYLHVHIHPAASSFSFNQAFAIQAGISYKIRVIADDASSNSAVSSAEIICN
ncbi:MAG: DUF4625 domain-containing protein [Chitinophagaceae bacterium]|nr:DUF4625 domain-containing protein [Chitinophagaceae bacterium]